VRYTKLPDENYCTVVLLVALWYWLLDCGADCCTVVLYVVLWCWLLHCGAVCCTVVLTVRLWFCRLHCGAVACTVVLIVALWCWLLHCGAECCTVMLQVALWCWMLHCGAECLFLPLNSTRSYTSWTWSRSERTDCFRTLTRPRKLRTKTLTGSRWKIPEVSHDHLPRVDYVSLGRVEACLA